MPNFVNVCTWWSQSYLITSSFNFFIKFFSLFAPLPNVFILIKFELVWIMKTIVQLIFSWIELTCNRYYLCFEGTTIQGVKVVLKLHMKWPIWFDQLVWSIWYGLIWCGQMMWSNCYEFTSVNIGTVLFLRSILVFHF